MMQRNLFPKYSIRGSAIQGVRTLNKMKVSLDALIGKFSVFELRNFDNIQPPKVKTTFKASIASVVALREIREPSTSKHKN